MTTSFLDNSTKPPVNFENPVENPYRVGFPFFIPKEGAAEVIFLDDPSIETPENEAILWALGLKQGAVEAYLHIVNNAGKWETHPCAHYENRRKNFRFRVTDFTRLLMKKKFEERFHKEIDRIFNNGGTFDCQTCKYETDPFDSLKNSKPQLNMLRTIIDPTPYTSTKGDTYVDVLKPFNVSGQVIGLLETQETRVDKKGKMAVKDREGLHRFIYEFSKSKNAINRWVYDLKITDELSVDAVEGVRGLKDIKGACFTADIVKEYLDFDNGFRRECVSLFTDASDLDDLVCSLIDATPNKMIPWVADYASMMLPMIPASKREEIIEQDMDEDIPF